MAMNHHHIPQVYDISNVIFVMMRFSSRANENEERRCIAGSAIVGARMHDNITYGGSRLQGRTLIILLATSRKGGQGMPAYYIEGRNFSLCVRVMDELDRVYGQVTRKPTVWFVSRSISSATIASNGWTPFLRRYDNWHENMHLIYQVRGSWPAPDVNPPQPALVVPWILDPLYRFKWVHIPLIRWDRFNHFNPTPGDKMWWATLKIWVHEENRMRSDQLDDADHTRVSGRGIGRLGFV